MSTENAPTNDNEQILELWEATEPGYVEEGQIALSGAATCTQEDLQQAA